MSGHQSLSVKMTSKLSLYFPQQHQCGPQGEQYLADLYGWGCSVSPLSLRLKMLSESMLIRHHLCAPKTRYIPSQQRGIRDEADSRREGQREGERGGWGWGWEGGERG